MSEEVVGFMTGPARAVSGAVWVAAARRVAMTWVAVKPGVSFQSSTGMPMQPEFRFR